MADDDKAQQGGIEAADQGTGAVPAPFEADGAAPKSEATPEQAAVDWEQRSQELAKELERTNQRLASITGNVRKQAETDALLVRHGELLMALVEHQANPEADPKALQTKVQEIQQKTAADLASSRTAQVAQGYLASIGRMLSEAGMQGNDPKLAQATRLWQQGSEAGSDPLALLEAVDEVRRVTTEAIKEAAKKEGSLDRRRANAEAGTLAQGAQGGGGAKELDGKELEKAVAAGTVQLTPAINARLNKYWNS